MVQGALAKSRAQLAVAVTGIAGPDGGTPGVPPAARGPMRARVISLAMLTAALFFVLGASIFIALVFTPALGLI